MKFRVQRKAIHEAFKAMHEVATKGIKSEFKMAHCITLKANKDSLMLYASNGNMDAQCEITKGLQIEQEGIATLDANKSYSMVSAVNRSDDAKLEFEKTTKGDSTSLRIRDTSVKRKAWAKLPVKSVDHVFSLPTPRKGFKHSLSAPTLSEALGIVARYKDYMQYEPVHLVVCMHFLPECNRFICGDGGLFGCLEYKNTTTNSDVDADGAKYILPADQASIISHLVQDKKDATIFYKDPQSCSIESDNIKLLVKGIPDIRYVEYQDYAYKHADASAVVDIPREEFRRCLDLIGAAEDLDIKEEGSYHSCTFEVADNGVLDFAVLDGKFQCETQCSVKFYEASSSSFKSEYAYDILASVANAGKSSVLRFYAIDPDGVVIIEPIDIDPDSKGEDPKTPDAHAPIRIDKVDEPQLILFFTSVESDDEENNEE